MRFEFEFYIFQTEESLTELQMSIHPTATEKIFSVLKSDNGGGEDLWEFIVD